MAALGDELPYTNMLTWPVCDLLVIHGSVTPSASFGGYKMSKTAALVMNLEYHMGESAIHVGGETEGG